MFVYDVIHALPSNEFASATVIGDGALSSKLAKAKPIIRDSPLEFSVSSVMGARKVNLFEATVFITYVSPGLLPPSLYCTNTVSPGLKTLVKSVASPPGASIFVVFIVPPIVRESSSSSNVILLVKTFLTLTACNLLSTNISILSMFLLFSVVGEPVPYLWTSLPFCCLKFTSSTKPLRPMAYSSS